MPRVPISARFIDIRGLFKRPYYDSVFRRTAILLVLVVPAFAATMFVNYGAAALLAPDQFGVFYVAVTISNVLSCGSLVLNMVFTRYLISIDQQGGSRATLVGLGRLERAVMGWGALVAAAAYAVLWAFGHNVGMQSNVITLLVILDAYTCYFADLGRILLQSLRRTVSLGLYTLVWLVLRFVLCVIGLMVFRTVWGGFLGIVASAVIVSAALHVWAAMQRRDIRLDVPPVPSPLTMLPVAVGYGLTITVSSLDVLLGYFLLNGDDLGVYSASSVFPKAIIVIIMPILQMLFPIALGTHLSGRQSHGILAKSAIVIVGAAVCGSVATWALSGLLCGGIWGIKHCEAGTLDTLLWSVTPLVLLRALVFLQFGRGFDRLAIWLGIPALIYAWVAFASAHSIAIIARQFCMFAAAAFVFLAVIQVAAEIRGSSIRPSLGKQ